MFVSISGHLLYCTNISVYACTKSISFLVALQKHLMSSKAKFSRFLVLLKPFFFYARLEIILVPFYKENRTKPQLIYY